MIAQVPAVLTSALIAFAAIPPLVVLTVGSITLQAPPLGTIRVAQPDFKAILGSYGPFEGLIFLVKALFSL